MTEWLGRGFVGTDANTAKRFKKCKLGNGALMNVGGKFVTWSGNVAVRKNDTAVDESTGHKYKAQAAGQANVIQWKYDSTPISAKPSLAPTNLGKPTRLDNTHKMKATWKIPAAMTASTSRDRATSLEVMWSLDRVGDKASITGIFPVANRNATDYTINLNDLTLGNTHYTRASFYPYAGKPRVIGVGVRVRGVNAKGKGPWTNLGYREFYAPKQPNVPAFSFNQETGTASTTVTIPEAETGHAERNNSHYTWVVKKKAGGSLSPVVNQSDDFTAASRSFSYDFDDYQGLLDGEYYVAELTCFSRGYGGDGERGFKRFVIGPPARASIGNSAMRSIAVSSKTSTGVVRVPVSIKHSYVSHVETVTKDGKKVKKTVNDYAIDQITGIRLQVLANVPYAKASQIPGDATWNDAGSPDDDGCEMLATGVSDLLCDPGNRSWVRLKTWRFDADNAAMTRYSEPVEVPGLYAPAPTAADDECSILSATPGSDGTSVDLVVAWDKMGAGSRDDATGTELTWSDDPDCWKSTVAPESHEFEWSDASSASADWWYTASITVKKLTEGTPYWFRARRYHEGDVVTYGKYSATKSATPTVAPSEVVLAGPDYIASGRPLPLTWTFAGGGTQRSWEVSTAAGTVLASGKDAKGACSIPWARIAPHVASSRVQLRVKVSTGGDPAMSGTLTVRIATAPTLEITAPTLTAQPFTFTATSNTRCMLTAVVRSLGVPYQAPDGQRVQPAGDVVWSGTLDPAWTASGGDYTATCAADPGLAFLDGGRYELTATATASTSGLESPTRTAEFVVDWVRKAPSMMDGEVEDAPQTCVEVIAYDDDEAAGLDIPDMACAIALTPPTDAIEGDVYDIYRMSPDGAQLIGEGYPTTYTAIDPYAPYGDGLTLAYRVAIRTVDGDIAWADYEYVMEGGFIRFDWGREHVELPYNIELSDGYEKGGEVREHMDGSMTAHWNGNVKRKGKLNTDLIRLASQEDVALVRSLARYPRPAFVRLPDGCAYEADVNVEGLDTDGPLLAASFDAVEVALTGEFALEPPEGSTDDEGQG